MLRKNLRKLYKLKQLYSEIRIVNPNNISVEMVQDKWEEFWNSAPHTDKIDELDKFLMRDFHEQTKDFMNWIETVPKGRLQQIYSKLKELNG